MKILFISPFVNNSHFIKVIRNTFDKHIKNARFDIMVLNDAPDIGNGEPNNIFGGIVSMVSGSKNPYIEIYNESVKYDCIHVKIPQEIHPIDRPNHESHKHIENLMYIFENIDKIIDISEYDFLCTLDADVALVSDIDMTKELSGFDMIAPIIKMNNREYPLVALFFINLNTVKNFKDMDFRFDYPRGVDTGANLYYFLQNNPQYTLKRVGYFDGWHKACADYNRCGEYKVQIVDKICDLWFNDKFLHIRGGSCFGIGSKQHRTRERVDKYVSDLKNIYDHFGIDFEIPRRMGLL